MTSTITSSQTQEEDLESGNKIIIKGSKDGLVIFLPNNVAWNDILHQLSELLDKDKNFWIGAATSVDLRDHKLDEVQLNRFYEMLIKRHHVILNSVYAKDDQTRSFAEKLNLRVGKMHPLLQKNAPPNPSEITIPVASGQNNNSGGSNAMYLKQTLRSGQIVRFDGNVIVYGDTNPGSEIIASGDIIVIGTLRGIAHAGAKGDEGSQIIATNLKATQLRIASIIGVSSGDGSGLGMPECASVLDGKIYIAQLKSKK